MAARPVGPDFRSPAPWPLRAGVDARLWRRGPPPDGLDLGRPGGPGVAEPVLVEVGRRSGARGERGGGRVAGGPGVRAGSRAFLAPRPPLPQGRCSFPLSPGPAYAFTGPACLPRPPPRVSALGPPGGPAAAPCWGSWGLGGAGSSSGAPGEALAGSGSLGPSLCLRWGRPRWAWRAGAPGAWVPPAQGGSAGREAAELASLPSQAGPRLQEPQSPGGGGALTPRTSCSDWTTCDPSARQPWVQARLQGVFKVPVCLRPPAGFAWVSPCGQ